MCWLCQKIDDLTRSLEATLFKNNMCIFYPKTHLSLSHESNIPLSIYILSGCRQRANKKLSYLNLIIFTRARRLLNRQREVRIHSCSVTEISQKWRQKKDILILVPENKLTNSCGLWFWALFMSTSNELIKWLTDSR